ncbi:hypothetical protein [Anaerocolumna xylanovorans]|uniref:Pre-peptidase C-terminal domain-containing protein n=1 Tax=Anaerocolumna xylanovorans DSM 12503 TaxID=1121345 RepID=A0A1M7Y9L3_9FIRM|nr:hypothetical protein [Anaerocolumna xylanovorans]SHO49218.1 hypothetical protein SAMN02745217_02204 [Anaerocolumna xylanovorans DSM 12503]
MKRVFKKLLTCAVILTAVFSLLQIRAMASPKVYSTTIYLDKPHNYEVFDLDMPKDGKIKINAKIRDTGTIPGILTVSIQKNYKEGSPKVKEITGITAATPVTDLEVELSKGEYCISYKLSNATGDLTDTEIFLSCTAEILSTSVTNISELKVNSINSFDQITDKGYEELKFGDGKNDNNIVIPFTVKNGGGLYISMAPGKERFEDIIGAVYKDKECTKAVGKSFRLESVVEPESFLRNLPDSGTYYVKFTLDNIDYEPAGETKFLVKLYEINGADRAITFGKPTLAYQDKAGKKINYKITVKTTGYLVVDVNPADTSTGGKASFRLLDKNKKAITKSSTVYNAQEDDSTEYGPVEKYYTVPAGTYYIQVTASDSIYELVGSLEKCKTNAGPSKAKAKSLKVMKTFANGYFTTADSTAEVDWYKFTANSNQFIQVYMRYVLDGKFDYEVLNSKGKVLYKLSKGFTSKEGAYQVAYSNYFDKGTYYIKIYKSGTASSVSYTLQLLDYEYLKN